MLGWSTLIDLNQTFDFFNVILKLFLETKKAQIVETEEDMKDTAQAQDRSGWIPRMPSMSILHTYYNEFLL